MKKLTMILLLTCAACLVKVYGQGTVQEICIGSGVHCATLDYGAIKMTFVKGASAPGIRIKEVK